MVDLVAQRKWESKPSSLERGEVNAQNFIYYDGAVVISGHIYYRRSHILS